MNNWGDVNKINIKNNILAIFIIKNVMNENKIAFILVFIGIFGVDKFKTKRK